MSSSKHHRDRAGSQGGGTRQSRQKGEARVVGRSSVRQASSRLGLHVWRAARMGGWGGAQGQPPRLGPPYHKRQVHEQRQSQQQKLGGAWKERARQCVREPLPNISGAAVSAPPRARLRHAVPVVVGASAAAAPGPERCEVCSQHPTPEVHLKLVCCQAGQHEAAQHLQCSLHCHTRGQLVAPNLATTPTPNTTTAQPNGCRGSRGGSGSPARRSMDHSGVRSTQRG